MASQLAIEINNKSYIVALVVLLIVLMVYRHHMKIQKLEEVQDNMCQDGMTNPPCNPTYAGHGDPRAGGRFAGAILTGSGTENSYDSRTNVIKGTTHKKPEGMGGRFEPPVFWPIGDVQAVRNTRDRGGFKTIVVTDENGKKRQVLADANGNIVQNEDGSPYAASYIVSKYDEHGNPSSYSECPSGQVSLNNVCSAPVVDGFGDSDLLNMSQRGESFYGY
jgi:hypothetical protein